MKHILFIFLLQVPFYIYAQNCTNGILDGDEIDIDCGGLYCPKCIDENNPSIQNIMTHTKLGSIERASINLAIDSSGEKAIISSFQTGGGNKVYTASTDGSTFMEIADVNIISPGGDLEPAKVDISRDGTKVLWTTGKGQIIVSDFNGQNRTAVADKLKNQEEESGDIELYSETTPKFNSDGTTIFFVHSRDGSKNRGIWEVGISQSIATNQLMSVEDLSENFTETIWNLGGTSLFYELEVTENNDIQFLSNIFNDSSLDKDLLIYRNNTVEILVDNALRETGGLVDQHTISKDGKFSFWIESENWNTEYFRLEHETGIITSLDLVSELSPGINVARQITSNYNGSLLHIRGDQSTGIAQHVLVKNNGEEYYPLHMAHGFINNMISVPFLKLAETKEKMIFIVSPPNPELFEIWSTDVTPTTNELDSRYPTLDNLLITNNVLIPNVSKSEFRLSTSNGESEAINQLSFSTFSADTLHTSDYFFTNQGTQLYDDGISFGDNFIDNIYTHNDVFNRPFIQRELPYEISVRFNLITDNVITSYDVYPFFIVDQLNNLNLIATPSIKIYPTLLNDADQYINIEATELYSTISWNIFDIAGNLMEKSELLTNLDTIKVTNLLPGTYILQIELDGKRSTTKFVKQ